MSTHIVKLTGENGDLLRIVFTALVDATGSHMDALHAISKVTHRASLIRRIERIAMGEDQTPQRTIIDTARDHAIAVGELLSASRKPKLVAARRDAARRLHEAHGLGPSEIGRLLDRHHTSVLSLLREPAR